MSDIKTLAIERLNILNPEYRDLIEDIVVANKKIYLSLKTDKSQVDKFIEKLELCFLNDEEIELWKKGYEFEDPWPKNIIRVLN